MLERDIESYIIKMVKKQGGMAIKLLSYTQAGLPDRLILMPGGKVWFAELKRPGQHPRAVQKWMHKQLEKLGHDVLVFDSREAIDKWLGGE